MRKRRSRKAILLALVLCLIAGGALADSWSGTVTSVKTELLEAPATGVLSSLELEEGQTVTEDEEVGEVRASRTFSPADGTVAAIHADPGDEVSGVVLEIEPVSRYTVVCTVADQADTPETALVHSGEAVWMQCTADGSHQAVGRITTVEGSEYNVEVTGGELYVGETVYLYRDAAYATEALIGKGTVINHDTVSVSGEGVLLNLRVEAGDPVERGQWLFSTASSAETRVTVPESGVITSVSKKAGDSVQEGETLAEITTLRGLRIQPETEDAGLFAPGQTCWYLRGDDPHETLHPCTVNRVLVSKEGGETTVTVELLPSEEDLPLGLTVTVLNEE